jgi:hypothetical protein
VKRKREEEGSLVYMTMTMTMTSAVVAAVVYCEFNTD